MLDTKCKREKEIKFKNENQCPVQLSNDEIQFENYSNLISNYDDKKAADNRISNRVSNVLSASNISEDQIRNQTKYGSEIGFKNANIPEVDRMEFAKENDACTANDLENRRSVQSCDNVPNRADKRCSNEINEINEIKTASKSSPINKSNVQSNLNELDKKQLNACSSQASLQTGHLKSIVQSSLIQHPETSFQSNQHSSPQPTCSQPAHENHSVHFVNRIEKQPSISIGHFSIYLDRLDYEYRPSDTLTGKLHILLESGQLNLRRVVIYLKGISSVK